MNRTQRRQAARGKRKDVFLKGDTRLGDADLVKSAKLASRVKHSPVSPDEERVLEWVIILAQKGTVIPDQLALLAKIEPIEALIYLEHFKAELNGRPNHEYAKQRLEQIAKLKAEA
jgi:hypothetical protein